MKAQVIINKNYIVGQVDPRLYGSFVEHIGRSVYTGIYEPGHATADEMGFRQDVLEFVKKLQVPVIRYPGGNFVSGYNWEDGTGDRSKRPRRLDCAWGDIETNEVGIDEFQEWAKRADTQIMMAVNLGTRGPAEARNLLEYCNLASDTHYANLRRQNGFEEPFGIKTWCLGNEMDGPWQIGHKTAEEYARIAVETAKLMKMTDPDIELVACGSAYQSMPTFGSWELTVLDHAYEYIDYISLHQYYRNASGNTRDFLGKSVRMDQYIKGVAAICDAIKAKKHSDKVVNLSFDEWNVWSLNVGDPKEKWQVAPPRCEDIYTFEDALLVGCMLMTLQNNCDRVKIGCMAQLVNVIAPIMTEKGGKAWVQTIFYPYLYASVCGRGTVMKPVIACDSYATTFTKEVPYIETSIVHNAEHRTLTVFAVNRSLEEDMELMLTFEDFGDCIATEHIELYCDELKATNTADCEIVAPVRKVVQSTKGTVHGAVLKKHSWNMFTYQY